MSTPDKNAMKREAKDLKAEVSTIQSKALDLNYNSFEDREKRLSLKHDENEVRKHHTNGFLKFKTCEMKVKETDLNQWPACVTVDLNQDLDQELNLTNNDTDVEWRIELIDDHISSSDKELHFKSEEQNNGVNDKKECASGSQSYFERDSLTCIYCSQTLDNRMYLEAHMVNVHGLKLGKDSVLSKLSSGVGLESFEISQKEKLFGNVSVLQNPIEHHSDLEDKAFKCPSCCQVLADEQSYKAHCLLHVGETSFRCYYCGMEFGRRHLLHVHARNHTGEKPFKCDYCGKAFSRNGSLSRHKKTHSGEKPYECDICGKTFSCKKSRNRHHGKHTEKALDLSFNPKSEQKDFQSQSLMHAIEEKMFQNSHQNNLEDSKPSHSDIQYELNQMSSDYQSEMNVSKRFHCAYCDKSYIYKRDLRRHHLKNHPDIKYEP